MLTVRSPGPAQPVNTTLTITAKTLTEATICSGGPTLPAAPTNLRATSSSASTVKLTWAASSGATSYKVYRKTPSTNWTLINTATTTSYTDTLANGNKTTVSFSYYVQACNSAGCSAATKTATVPFAPTSFTATAGTGRVVLKWTDKSGNERGFEIYWKPGACSAGGTWTKIATTVANVKTYTNTDLDAGKTYSYKVRAYKRSASPYAYGYSAYTSCANGTVK
jgi:fibronectin type 3 domain-containing protein